MLCFRTCSSCTTCSQAILCHYTIGMVSIHAQMTLIYSSVTFWEETAPVKLPARYCLCTFFPCRLANAQLQMAISLSSRVQPKPYTSNLSPLFYAVSEHLQYQARVKLLGSFRLSAGNRHLHRYCIFTELLPETVPQSLHLSCASELTRQGISLPQDRYSYGRH